MILNVIVQNLQQPITNLEDTTNRHIACRPGDVLKPNELLAMVVVTSRWRCWGRDPSLRCCRSSSVVTSATACPLSGCEVAVGAGSDRIPLFCGDILGDMTHWWRRRRPCQQNSGLIRLDRSMMVVAQRRIFHGRDPRMDLPIVLSRLWPSARCRQRLEIGLASRRAVQKHVSALRSGVGAFPHWWDLFYKCQILCFQSWQIAASPPILRGPRECHREALLARWQVAGADHPFPSLARKEGVDW